MPDKQINTNSISIYSTNFTDGVDCKSQVKKNSEALNDSKLEPGSGSTKSFVKLANCNLISKVIFMHFLTKLSGFIKCFVVLRTKLSIIHFNANFQLIT